MTLQSDEDCPCCLHLDECLVDVVATDTFLWVESSVHQWKRSGRGWDFLWSRKGLDFQNNHSQIVWSIIQQHWEWSDQATLFHMWRRIRMKPSEIKGELFLFWSTPAGCWTSCHIYNIIQVRHSYSQLRVSYGLWACSDLGLELFSTMMSVLMAALARCCSLGPEVPPLSQPELLLRLHTEPATKFISCLCLLVKHEGKLTRCVLTCVRQSGSYSNRETSVSWSLSPLVLVGTLGLIF